jgi:hypothetical protein
VAIAAAFVALASGSIAAWLIVGGSESDSPRDSQAAAAPPSRFRAATRSVPREREAATPPAPRQRPAAVPPRSRHHDETTSSQGYSLLPRIEPARIIPDPEPVAPTDVLQPIVNGWRAGDHRGITLVEAGLAGDDASGTTGRFVVFRERERPFAQNVDVVDVPGAGALRITRAPVGRRAGRRAQRRGEIEFAGEEKITGTLHLAHDTITLDAR